MTQLPAVVQASHRVVGDSPGVDWTIVILVPPPDFDYSAPGVEWPMTLFLSGDVKEQNPPGTEYKITIERVEEQDD